jgi:hypothetical protein
VGRTITLDGANLYQVLLVYPSATLNLNNLTVAHGNSGGAGGGVEVYTGATLAITNSTFSGNTGGLGGGVNNSGTLTVASSIFSDNTRTSLGGGIYNNGNSTVTITNSTFSGNSTTAGSSGGGILNEGTLTISNSTFSGNSAGGGAGITNISGILSVYNSTFSKNSAAAGGGGIANVGGSTALVIVINSTFSGNSGGASYGGAIYTDLSDSESLTVTNCTFSDNSAAADAGGGGIGFQGTRGTIELANNIFAGNFGGDRGGSCRSDDGLIGSEGFYNISDDASCGFGQSLGANGKLIGDKIKPLLAAAGLANNGGPTKTIALQTTSPAIAAIPVADCPATDQRGAPRPAPGDSAYSIGAFEYGGVVPAPTLTLSPMSLGFLSVGIGKTKTLPLTIKNSGKGGTLTGNVATVSAPFTVTSGGGGFSLSPGQTKIVAVEFVPTIVGAVSATLVITSNDPKHASVNVKITGTGQSGDLSVPSLLTFLTTSGGTSFTKTLTIRNLGLGVLHGNVGTSTGPFAVTAGGGAFTLDDGKTQIVTIQFTPIEKGAAAGVLPITSDDPKHLSVGVNLKGTGK